MKTKEDFVASNKEKVKTQISKKINKQQNQNIYYNTETEKIKIQKKK